MSSIKKKLKYINEELEYILINTQLTMDSLTSTERSNKDSIEVAELMFREVEDSIRNLKQSFATEVKIK